MTDHVERRTRPHESRGDPDRPLSETVAEAITAHEDTTVQEDEFRLYDHVDPDALDRLFADGDQLDMTLRIALPNVTVSIWSDDGVDVRVTSRPR